MSPSYRTPLPTLEKVAGDLDSGIKPTNLLMGDKVSLLKRAGPLLPSDYQVEESILSPGLIQPSNKLYTPEGILASLLLD